MFATVIKDAFKKGEEKDIALALNDLCCATDTYGWASAGIYSFWNYYTKEIYYIGLAVDLEERFKQHTGITVINQDSCKKNYIDLYFKKYDKLGYSIFVQSPLSQPITNKNKHIWRKEDIKEMGVLDLRGGEDREDLKIVEGILIQAYKLKYGRFPAWNNVGGSIKGQVNATIGNYDIVESFVNEKLSPLVARATIRELSGDPVFTGFEIYLHAVRMHMLYHQMSFEEAINFVKEHDILNTNKRIMKMNYLNRKLIF